MPSPLLVSLSAPPSSVRSVGKAVEGNEGGPRGAFTYCGRNTAAAAAPGDDDFCLWKE